MDLQRRIVLWYAYVLNRVGNRWEQRHRLRLLYALACRRAACLGHLVSLRSRKWVLLARADAVRRSQDLRAWLVGKTAHLHPRLLFAIKTLQAWHRQAMARLDTGRPAALLRRARACLSWPHVGVRNEGRYGIEVSSPHATVITLGTAALLLLLIALPAFAGRDLINDLIFVFTMLALAQCWNLLAGYAGLVSVGQQAFVGLGGYLLFAFTVRAGVDPLGAVLLAGLIAGVLALPTALVIFRLRGAHFAIGTWVMAEVYRLVFAQIKPLGGGTGTSLPPYVTN